MQFITINQIGKEGGVVVFANQMNSPVLQDTSALNVWSAFGAVKDNTIIVDKNGIARYWFHAFSTLDLPADAAKLKSYVDALRT